MRFCLIEKSIAYLHKTRDEMIRKKSHEAVAALNIAIRKIFENVA